MSRSRWLAMGLVAVLVAACSSSPGGSEGPSQPSPAEPTTGASAPPAALEPITVAIYSGPEADNLKKTAAAYTATTGGQVTVEDLARDGYLEKVRITLVGGGPDYDVVLLGADWMPGLVAANSLEPLDAYLGDPAFQTPDFVKADVEAAMEFAKFNGAVFGLPTEGDTAWLWYREDLLNAAGIKPPETMEELRAAARALTTADRYGLVIGGRRDEIMYDFIHYFFPFGGRFYDPTTYDVEVNDAAAVEALTFYASLVKEKVVPPDVTQYGYNEILTALQQDKAAMGIEWMAATRDLTSCDTSPKVCKTLKYKTVPVKDPAKPGYGGSQSAWSVPAGSVHKASAYRFIQWLVGRDGAKTWALNGGIPSNVTVLADPEVVAEVPQFALLAKVLPHRQILPVNTVSAELVNAFADAASAGLSGADPQTVLDEAAVKMEKALREAGYLP